MNAVTWRVSPNTSPSSSSLSTASMASVPTAVSSSVKVATSQTGDHSTQYHNVVEHGSKKKRVTFFHSVHCFLLYGHKETSQNGWYSDQDYSDFRRDIEIVERCINDHCVQGTERFYCTRGIEHFVDKNARNMKCAHRIAAWNDVLDAQKRLRSTIRRGDFSLPSEKDDKFVGAWAVLAEAYRNQSESSQKQAYARGLQDQLEAGGPTRTAMVSSILYANRSKFRQSTEIRI